ncbi:MAG: RMD1 family protein [Cytophagales bacterium]|nr:MAG: RMD1 family protein [Cytophagales bacterium]
MITPTLNIQAYQIAESLNIRKFKAEFTANPHSGNNYEIFYKLENQRYLYVFHHGVIVLAGYDEVSRSELILFAKKIAAKEPLETEISEEYAIIFDQSPEIKVTDEYLSMPDFFSELAIKIVMLSVGQSVGLEYYENLGEEMLNSTEQYVKQLAEYGKIKTQKKKLLKFIGRTLMIKNSVIDNLYILDPPELVWNDASLDQLNKQMKEVFDIYARFRDLDYRLQIIEGNLRLFTEILQHRESNNLEIIVIILILIEVINLFWKEILGF